MRRVLVVQAGEADPAVRARFGDYPEWFARLLAPHVALQVVQPEVAPLPHVASFDGVVVTGSPRSVMDRDPWMSETAAYLVDAARTRPVLGVCFGHQLLADALGGRVERNPLGREAGTVDVQLTDAGAADALFAGVPRTLAVQQTHCDHVTELPPRATLLATGAVSPVQAFGVGEAIRCVQFHPEMDAARSRALNEARVALLDEQAPGGARAVLATIRETPAADRVLLNWLVGFVGART